MDRLVVVVVVVVVAVVAVAVSLVSLLAVSLASSNPALLHPYNGVYAYPNSLPSLQMITDAFLEYPRSLCPLDSSGL